MLQRGFTLIEMLLVIALISAIAVFSIGIYQQQATNFKIDKTALQMQQWLEGAKAYYVDCSIWPGFDVNNPNKAADPVLAYQQLEGHAPRCDGQQVTYVQPGAIDINPWGNTYSMLVANSAGFGVEAIIASTDVLPHAVQIGQQIAARLPNAEVRAMSGPVTVNAFIAIPGGAAGNNPHQSPIVSVQDLDCTHGCPTIQQPSPGSCPPGMNPVLHVALQNYNKDNLHGYSYQISGINITPNNVNGDNPLQVWPITPTITQLGPAKQANSYGGSVLAIIACEKPSAHANNITQSTALPYRF